ncbi:hypothetical protein [Pseudonocardia adelaidensis]|uniref:Uncharacterized protein n=1 Tax=Pseudonocardia adelaidensis TaxID=648754 RepID=A0ABP9P7S3_9PSEU
MGGPLTVERLLTTADVEDRAPDDGRVSVRARHDAVLTDGRRLLLLDDRGWASSATWTATSVAEVEETARMVVGPDEPAEGRTWKESQAGHWAYLARRLHGHGVRVDPGELRRLPHDVVLGDRLRARIARG